MFIVSVMSGVDILLLVLIVLYSCLSTMAINASYDYCHAVHVWQIKKIAWTCRVACKERGVAGCSVIL